MAVFRILVVSIFAITVVKGLPASGHGEYGDAPAATFIQGLSAKEKRSPSKEEEGHTSGGSSGGNTETENNNSNNQVENCVGGFVNSGSSYIPGGGNGGSFIPSGGSNQFPGASYIPSFPPKQKRSPPKEEEGHATGGSSGGNTGTENNNNNNQVQNCVGSFVNSGSSYIPGGGSNQFPGASYIPSFPPKQKRSPPKEEEGHATGGSSGGNAGTENNNSNNQVENCVGGFVNSGSSYIPGGGNGGSFIPSGGSNQFPGASYIPSFPPKQKRSPPKEEEGHATGGSSGGNTGTENNNNNNQVQNCVGSFVNSGSSYIPGGGSNQFPGASYIPSFPPKQKRSPPKEEEGHATGGSSGGNTGTENNNSNNQVENCVGGFVNSGSSYIPGGGNGGSFIPSGGSNQFPGASYIPSFPPKQKRSPPKEEEGHATGGSSGGNTGTENNNNNNNQVQNCVGSFVNSGSSYIPGGGSNQFPGASYIPSFPPKQKRSPPKEEEGHANGGSSGGNTGTENNNNNNQVQNCVGSFVNSGSSYIPGGGSNQFPGASYIPSFPPKQKRSPPKEEEGHATGGSSGGNAGTENNNNNNQVQNCVGGFVNSGSSYIPGGGNGGSFIPSGGSNQFPGASYIPSFPPKQKRSPPKEEEGHATGGSSGGNTGTENNNNNNNQVQNCVGSFVNSGSSYIPGGGSNQFPGASYIPSFPPKQKRSPPKEEEGHANGGSSGGNTGTENNNNNNQVQNCVGSFVNSGSSYIPGGGSNQFPGASYIPSFPPKQKRSPPKEEEGHATGGSSGGNTGTENNNSNNQVQNCVGSFVNSGSSYIPGGGSNQFPGASYIPSFPPKQKRSPPKEEEGHATGGSSGGNTGTENNNSNNQVENCVGGFVNSGSSYIPGGGNGGSFIPSGGSNQFPGASYIPSFPPKQKRSPQMENSLDETSPFAFKRSPDSTTHMRVSYLSYSKVP